jgi:predicted kinase
MSELQFDTKVFDLQQERDKALALAEARGLALQQLARDTLQVVEYAKRLEGEVADYTQYISNGQKTVFAFRSAPLLKRIWLAALGRIV